MAPNFTKLYQIAPNYTKFLISLIVPNCNLILILAIFLIIIVKNRVFATAYRTPK
jgi:hypothetical protein